MVRVSGSADADPPPEWSPPSRPGRLAAALLDHDPAPEEPAMIALLDADAGRRRGGDGDDEEDWLALLALALLTLVALVAVRRLGQRPR